MIKKLFNLPGLAWVALLCTLGALGAASYTTMTGIRLINSTVDSTPIGNTAPTSGEFTIVGARTDGYTTSVPQGGYIIWNHDATGETDFVNSRGTGAGGFCWFNAATGAALPGALMCLDSSGNLTTNNFTGNLTGNITGTAAAFNHTPMPCTSGAASGIAANGNAICTGSGTVLAAVHFTSCAIVTHGSSDHGCQTSQNWPVSLGTTNYAVTCTLHMPDGFSYAGDSTGLTQSTITTLDLTATNFNYVLANVHDASAGSTQGVDCVATHR